MSPGPFSTSLLPALATEASLTGWGGDWEVGRASFIMKPSQMGLCVCVWGGGPMCVHVCTRVGRLDVCVHMGASVCACVQVVCTCGSAMCAHLCALLCVRACARPCVPERCGPALRGWQDRPLGPSHNPLWA